MLGGCSGNTTTDPPQESTLEVRQAPGTENEAITLRVNSQFSPPFENHEDYDFIIGGIGDGVGVGQRLDLARIRNPGQPTDHEIRTVVPLGGWLGFSGAFWHYVRSEYQPGAFTMVFGRKVTVPLHDPNAFLVREGNSFWVRGGSSAIDIMTLTPPTLTTNWSKEEVRAGAVLQVSDGTRWKFLDIQPAKGELPAYVEVVRLPNAGAASATLKNLPLR